jgi:hypothetical protein
MTTLARTLQKHSLTIYAALFVALIALLYLSPAEATLGNVVKIVYAHGAAERVSMYAYLLAGGLGLVALAIRHAPLARWAQAIAETAIVFWLAQFVISAPAQVLAWGSFTFNEPRVSGALWILALTVLVYLVARWVGENGWMALAAVANAVIFTVVLRGEIDILHPVDPIIGSDSVAIKIFYAAIVLVTGVIAAQFARERAENLAKVRELSQG